MRYLRQNTETIVTVGPFYDIAGLIIEIALTITNERISMAVDLNDGSAPTLVLDNVTGATSGTNNDLNYIANNDAGLMQIELSAANTNYVGRAFLTITDATNHCPVFHEFTILPQQVYDSLILGTDLLQIDVEAIDNDAPAAANLNSACDNYSATRGLAGTALPAAAADAAGGLIISDAGGLDADAIPVILADIDAEVDEIHAVINGIAVTGSALNKEAAAFTNTGGGTEVNDYTATAVANLTTHDIPALAGVIDCYYEHHLGDTGTPAKVNITGRLNEAPVVNEAIDLYVWRWDTSAWELLHTGIFSGTTGTANTAHSDSLLSRHRGTGADVGKVLVRFYKTGLTNGTTILKIDQILVEYAETLAAVLNAQGLTAVRAAFLENINPAATGDVGVRLANSVAHGGAAATFETAAGVLAQESSAQKTQSLARQAALRR